MYRIKHYDIGSTYTGKNVIDHILYTPNKCHPKMKLYMQQIYHYIWIWNSLENISICVGISENCNILWLKQSFGWHYHFSCGIWYTDHDTLPCYTFSERFTNQCSVVMYGRRHRNWTNDVKCNKELDSFQFIYKFYYKYHCVISHLNHLIS